ncbi:MAG: sodium-dependent transporter [Myxococcota bacterium]
MSQTRENWSSKLGFVLAAVGSAMGLGAIWRLPYTMGQNGGSAFILLFLLFNVVIGVPLFIAELALGRAAQQGTVRSFARFAPAGSLWAVGGWLPALAALLILGWYCVVAGWGIHYALMSLTRAFGGRSAHEIGALFDLFRASGELNVLFQLLFLAATAWIVARGLSAGIERYTRSMTLLLFALLAILVIYGTTLPGFTQALRYIFVPNFAAVTPTVLLQALALALFTLSLGHGPIMTYGSYMQHSTDLPKTAVMVCSANFVASLCIALAIFPLLFSFGFAPEGGEGLVFKILPFVFEQLPGSLLFGVLFFVLLIFTALTSSVAQMEVLVANLMDLRNITRTRAVWIATTAAFILGVPTALSESGTVFATWTSIYGDSFLATSNVLADWTMIIAALITSLFVGWRLPANICQQEFCQATAYKRLYTIWLWLIRVIVPLCVAAILLQRVGLFL